MNLQIIQGKPNPEGKWKGQDLASQLLGEWVDVKNVGDEAVTFQTMQLRHAFFDNDCHTTAQLELYWIGKNNGDLLKPGQTLRIHAGRQEDAHLMSAEDQAGADWHSYAETDNFILNNRCGDKIVLSWQGTDDQIHQDWACFAPEPAENMILKRSGNLLAQTYKGN